ncbi:hypothetical protein FOXYSP1_01362 [Fusarium oxysporum f. sp. phaseoli]
MGVLGKYNYHGSHSLFLALLVCELVWLMFTVYRPFCMSNPIHSGLHTSKFASIWSQQQRTPSPCLPFLFA